MEVEISAFYSFVELILKTHMYCGDLTVFGVSAAFDAVGNLLANVDNPAQAEEAKVRLYP